VKKEETKMNLKKVITTVMMSCLLCGTVFALQEFKADKVHSSVVFSIRHMMVGKVEGRFNDFDVTIMTDTADITKSTAAAVIKTAGIDTDNEQRDTHLRSADFFDVQKFPDITFKSLAVKKKDNNYLLWGTLSMHGVVKNIEIPFEILGHITDAQGNIRVGIEGKTTLDRKDYGLTWNKTLDQGGLAVGNEVEIKILLELVGKK
jgi:polyisoprenoid-binding protein YceI